MRVKRFWLHDVSRRVEVDHDTLSKVLGVILNARVIRRHRGLEDCVVVTTPVAGGFEAPDAPRDIDRRGEAGVEGPVDDVAVCAVVVYDTRLVSVLSCWAFGAEPGELGRIRGFLR